MFLGVSYENSDARLRPVGPGLRLGPVPKRDTVPSGQRQCDFDHGAGQKTGPHIFIRSGEPQDHGIFAVKAARRLPLGEQQRFEQFRMQMGTKVRIVLYADSEDDARKSASAAFDRIQQLDEILSDYNPESELMRLCRNGHERPTQVSPELFFVLEKSVRYSILSWGAFDVTVGPLVTLWRQARRTEQLPSAESLKKAQSLVSYKNLLAHPDKSTVFLRRSGMKLDLGGIAKGYAVDQALAVLSTYGIKSALVDAGGDIGVSQAPPGRQDGWRISIQNPAGAGLAEEATVVLRQGAVATSGDAEQFVEIAGRRYSHIVDPRTGFGVQHSASVTVIAPDCITADALATALSVLPPQEGIELAESQRGVACYIIIREKSSYRRFLSSRMNYYLEPARH